MMYRSRSSAVRAARNQCRKLLGRFYQAFEGPDYGIHPVSPTVDDLLNGIYRDRYTVELRGLGQGQATGDEAMRQLSKADDDRRTSEVESMRNAAQAVRDAIDKVNALIDQVNEMIDDEVVGAIGKYNEQLIETGGFVEDLVAQMSDYVDARSEKWQEGDAGQEYAAWKEGYESIDFSQIDDIEHIERIEYPEGLDTVADEFEQQATTPDA